MKRSKINTPLQKAGQDGNRQGLCLKAFRSNGQQRGGPRVKQGGTAG